ncbi:MAG: hypothetical protein IPL89_03475 [Acidobacteria bacterium]|nr:hypothetical protein [Acidobacteriota bacterium]
MKRIAGTGIILASVLGGIAGSLATVAVRSANAVAAPQTVAGTSTMALPPSAEARIAQLEQKLAALKTAYEGHGHPYTAPGCGGRVALSVFKEFLSRPSPPPYTICLIPDGSSPIAAGTTSKPVAAH